jgi:predicted naringenin-chalcone synthase
MKHGSILGDFRILRPRHRGSQSDALEWLAAAHARAEETLHPSPTDDERAEVDRRVRRTVMRLGAASDRIVQRGSVCDDFTHRDWHRMRVFPLHTRPSGAGASERARLYAEEVEAAFETLYAAEDTSPDVLVHVTCTGYVAPSGAQRLVARRGWGARTEVLHAYHMGCYASLPAIRIAGGLIAAGKSRVDVVHTELCTLHLDPACHTPEQIMVQSLFADGMVRYSMVSDESRVSADTEQRRLLRAGLRVIATCEEIVSDSGDAMGWTASDHGMRMSIARDVPERIDAALPGFLGRLADAAAATVSSLRARAIFAIHPGGPRIIDRVATTLGLSGAQVAPSNDILEHCGNMSSATLPHIWSAVLERDAIPAGTPVVSLAFGPGLTVSGAVLEKL